MLCFVFVDYHINKIKLWIRLNTAQDFENLGFNPFKSETFLGVSDSSHPDVNFFNSVPKEHTKDFSADDISVELNSSGKILFIILHKNIRNLNKNLENL